MGMELFYRTVGEGKPLIILHGLFGTSDNWTTIAKVFGEEYKVYMVDQRNHGRSPHSNIFSYEVMAEDLAEFIEHHVEGIPHILGHSMGGKTAMQMAVLYPELIDRLIVVDIAPKQYPVHHHAIIAGLQSLELDHITSRKEADEKLSKHIAQFGVRQFLLKNLYRKPDNSFGWRMNLPAIAENIEIIGKGLGQQDVFEGPTLFIRGKNSDYIQDNDKAVMLNHFPNSELQTIEGAGHWVHAEKPKELIDSVLAFLK